MLYCRICDDKKNVEEAINKGLENDANDEELKEWSWKVRQLFYATTVEPERVDYPKESEKINVVGGITNGDNSSPTNEATMKTPFKVAVNSNQSNLVKGSSPICNVPLEGIKGN